MRQYILRLYRTGPNKLVLSLLVLAAIFVVFETGANYLHWLETGQRVFRFKAFLRPSVNSELGVVTSMHPYLGFLNINTPAQDRAAGMITNNMGFPQPAEFSKKYSGCCDLPMPPEALKDTFVIGVFGNSIAHGLAQAIQQWPEYEAPLAALPIAQGRRVLVLNFALGGHRMPQQAMTLAYLTAAGVQIDLAIYYAGANELEAGDANIDGGVGLEFPTHSAWLGLKNSLDVELTPHILMSRLAMEAERKISQCQVFATCIVWNRMLFGAAQRGAAAFAPSQEEIAASDRRSHFIKSPTPGLRGLSHADRYKAVGLSWYRSTLMMGRLSAASGIPFIVIEMPSPWVHPSGHVPPGSTPELAAARRNSIPLAVEELTKGIGKLNRDAITAIDARQAFDDLRVDDPLVYLDPHGHMGRTGALRMLDFTIKALMAMPVPQRKS